MAGCRPLTDDEVRAILGCMDGNRYPLRDRCLFIVGILTGFRISELLSIRVGDVFQNGEATHFASVRRKNMKKKKAGRTAKLNAIAREAINLWVRSMGEVGPEIFLFKSRKGDNRAISRVQAWRILHEIYVTCMLDGKLGTHSMRKTFAKHIHALLGGDVRKTQVALGHESLNSTANYLPVAQEEVDDAVSKLKL